MPGLVSTCQFSLGQGCQVRSGWSEQKRSRGSGHVRTVLIRSGQVNIDSSVWFGQVRSGYDSSRQVSSGW